MPKIPTEKLEAAFTSLMAAAGKPIERIGNRPGQSGPTPKVYRLQNGQTMRLRTNNLPGVMAKVESGAVSARLPFETEDFLGIAFPAGTNTVVGYLVPAEVAARAMRDCMQEWLAADPSHSRDNRSRVLRFDGDGRSLYTGYANRWSEYCLGQINLDGNLGPGHASRLDEVIAEARRKIALEARKPESAVRISIDY